MIKSVTATTIPSLVHICLWGRIMWKSM